MAQYFVGFGEHVVTADENTHSVTFGPEYLQGPAEGMTIISMWPRKSGGTADVKIKAVYPYLDSSGPSLLVTWVIEFDYVSGTSASFILASVVSDEVGAL